MSAIETYLEAHDARFIDELSRFLSIPGISSLPEHAGDVIAAAEWAAGRCRAAGFETVEILHTAGHPAVFAEHPGPEGAPTVLIYGHVDVQPVDPLDEWTSPPFEPRTVDDDEGGRLYARGASDDKGNLLAPLLAVEALLQTAGRLPVHVKVLLEGEEEIGSPNLQALLQAEAERLACDLVLSADGSGLSVGEAPLLVTGFRGLCALELAVEGPRRDLHSGMYGGAVENPLKAISHLLASLHDLDGRVAVDGFYDDVELVSPEARELLSRPAFDEAHLRADLGVAQLTGEPGFTARERIWIRPTLEINGVWGGFQGAGIKTVIPRVAHAKISCRLVPGQDPERVLTALEAHLQAYAPVGTTVRITGRESGARAYSVPLEHPGLAAARTVVEEVCGQAPDVGRSGGTLPVCDLLRTCLGVDSVIFAAGAVDEGAHGPDEFFRLASFRRMQRAYAALLERLGETDLAGR